MKTTGFVVQRKSQNQGGRPPLKYKRHRKNIMLTLYEGIDDDLIAWFDSIPTGELALTIKTALRQGGMTVEQEEQISEDLMSDDAFAGFLDAL